MNIKMLARLLAISGAAICLGAIPALADGGHCRHVGGGVLTNFLDPATCGGPTGLCSDGTATGDLKGAIGVSVLAVTGSVFHVPHHLVTETGDTVLWKDADLTTFPTGDSGRVLADYLKGRDDHRRNRRVRRRLWHPVHGVWCDRPQQGSADPALRGNRLL